LVKFLAAKKMAKNSLTLVWKRTSQKRVLQIWLYYAGAIRHNKAKFCAQWAKANISKANTDGDFKIGVKLFL